MAIDWEPQPSLSEVYNELPGTFVDPAALFQSRPLPMAWDQAYYDQDGFKKRGGEMKLSAVQDPVQGQKLLRIALNRTRFPGIFTAPFNRKALKVQKHSLVRFSFTPFGWVDKLFRVEQQGISDEGGVQLVLKEEHASIYQPGPVAVVPPPSASYGGDRGAKIAVAGLNTAATGIESGTRAVDAIRVTWATTDQRILHTEVRFRKTGDADWQTSAPLRRDINSALISPLFPTTQYEIQVRHISIWNVPGDWASALRTTDAVTKNPITGAITYADGTPIDDLRPAEGGANVTEARVAAGITGQGPGATASASEVMNNQLFGPNDNRVFSSDFPKNGFGWSFLFNPLPRPVSSLVGEQDGLRIMTVNLNASAATQQISFGTSSSVRFRVTPGERLAVSIGVGATGPISSINPVIRFRDKTGGQLTGVTIGGTTLSGEQPFNTKRQSFVTVPADAYSANIEVYLTSSAAGSLVMTLTEPLVMTANASQTLFPPYVSGPNAESGADITLGNISAGFSGQGALATLNAVAWASHVTGVGKPADDATKSRVFTQQATPTGASINDIWVKLNASGQAVAVAAWNGSAWVDGGNVTSFYTAAGIVGQGALATLSAVDRSTIVGIDYQNLVGGELKALSEWKLHPTFAANWEIVQGHATFDDNQKVLAYTGTHSGLTNDAFVASAEYEFEAVTGISYLMALKVRSFSTGRARVSLQARFWNAAGAEISLTTLQTADTTTLGTATINLSGISVAPPGAVKGAVRLRVGANPAGEVTPAVRARDIAVVKAARLGQGIVREDGTTVLADGTVITAIGTAAGIIGQGPGATAPGSDVLNEFLPLGSNQIVNSAFERGEYGWGRGGAAANRGVNNTGYWGVTNVAYVNVTGTLAAGSTVGAMYSVPAQNLENVRRFAMPVTPGQRLFISVLMGTHRCRGRVNAHWFRANGTGYPAAEVFEGGFEYNGSTGGAVNGDPANMTEVGGFVIVPSDAKYVMLSVAIVGQGLANSFLYFTRGMLTVVKTGQTSWPAYNTGPADPIADRTNDNIAGGVVGQGPDATVNYTGNTYANNAAAIAAGRAVGWIYWNSTTNSRMTVTSPDSGRFALTQDAAYVAYVGSGTGARTTAVVTVTPVNGTGTIEYTWRQITFDYTGWTITSPNGPSTRFGNTLTAGQSKSDLFEVTAVNGDGVQIASTRVGARLVNTA